MQAKVPRDAQYVLRRIGFDVDFEDDFVVFDIALHLVQYVCPGHEARVAPVVLLRRVIVRRLTGEVRHAAFLRDQPQLRRRVARPGTVMMARCSSVVNSS